MRRARQDGSQADGTGRIYDQFPGSRPWVNVSVQHLCCVQKRSTKAGLLARPKRKNNRAHCGSKTKDFRSPARSGRPVALLCAVILAVSSRPLRNTQREFGGRFIYV
jgi:hypothetical protein